jgi:hypothetical protein
MPTLAVVGSFVKISWTAPTANSRPILGYTIVIETSTTDTYEESTALCDGAAQASVRYCLVDMSDLRASPYYLTYDTLIRAKVYAYNARGTSIASDPNASGARVQVEPSALTAPTRGSTTGPAQVEVNWSSLTTPDNGGSSILSYHLQYDSGTSATNWTDVVGLSPDSLLLTYTVSSDIESGTEYGFRVRARNIFGWGSYSTPTYITAAREPDQPLAPTTSIDSTTGGLAISWVAPDARGDSITAYMIEILDKAGTTWSTDSSCDGTSSTVVSALACVVPMTTLTASPFSYEFDDVVIVRVSAYNSFGYGSVSSSSSSSTGAAIRGVPS